MSAAAAAAMKVVLLTPQVRVAAQPLAPPADQEQQSDEGSARRDAPFEELHRPREVGERRQLNGCVWFCCQACAKVRRLTSWNEKASKRRRLPTRCDNHPAARRAREGCVAADDWLAARLGVSFGESVHARLGAYDHAPSAEQGRVLAELGILITPLREQLLREHLFIAVPEDPLRSLRAAPPPLYQLAKGCIVWARAKQAEWWPGRVVQTAAEFGSGDTGDAYLVRFYGPGHPAGEQPVVVKTSRLRPFANGADDPAAATESAAVASLSPGGTDDSGDQDDARLAAIEAARVALSGGADIPVEQSPLHTVMAPGDDDSESDLSLDENDAGSTNDEDDEENDSGGEEGSQRHGNPPGKVQMGGRIPRKKDVRSADINIEIDGNAADSSIVRASSVSVSRDKESFAAAAWNAAQEQMASAKRASIEKQAKKRKSVDIQCHECGRMGHMARDCPAAGPGRTLGHAANPDTDVDDAATTSKVQQWLESSSAISPSQMDARFSGGNGTQRGSGRARPPLDSRIDALRAWLLPQVKQQVLAVGEQRLNMYMDSMAAEQRPV